MRKYFLISTVALLAASNVNAQISYSSNFTASASIQYPTTMNCSELKFGTVMLKNNTEEATVTLNYGSETHSDNVYSVENYAQSVCDYGDSLGDIVNLLSVTPDSITLTNASDAQLTVDLHSYIGDGNLKIGGTLTIPAGTSAGDYSATVTIFTILSNTSNDPA